MKPLDAIYHHIEAHKEEHLEKVHEFLRQIRLLRERMMPNAQAQGIFTDQGVFDRVS